MKLVEARVRDYQNLSDSTPVWVEPDVTCLVGKNESGKTAFLEALRNLNPARAGEASLNVTLDYPRWRMKRDRRRGDLGSIAPVRCVFEMDDADVEAISEEAGLPVPPGARVAAERAYDGRLRIRVDIEPLEVVRAIVEEVPLDDGRKEAASRCATTDELREFAKDARDSGGNNSRPNKLLRNLTQLADKADELLAEDLDGTNLGEAIQDRVPKFFYFGQYSSLPGRIDLNELLNTAEEDMDDEDRTAMSLLRLAGVVGEEFTDENLEARIAELESAANTVTAEVFRFWTQNEDLQVTLFGSSRTVQTGQGETAVHDQVDIRLNDLRHQVSTNLERRSAGFRWFFSFIAAFSEFEDDDNVIVLLDEPGLNLHARAQEDFLRFIEERLAERHQVLYTTHSLFMVQPRRLERVRLVEDHSTRLAPDEGARISDDALAVHADTIFPLLGALGIDFAQSLFVSGDNLVVEGTSDFVYLEAMSERLASLGREALADAWTVVPVGGADKVPTFCALLGAHLRDVTVLLDASGQGNQRLEDLAEQGILDRSRIITVASVSGKKRADIEDLFEPEEYLPLYNAALGESVEPSDLNGSDPILRRLERHRGGEKFDHRRPSTELLRNKAGFFDGLSEATLGRFEALFSRINATLAR